MIERVEGARDSEDVLEESLWFLDAIQVLRVKESRNAAKPSRIPPAPNFLLCASGLRITQCFVQAQLGLEAAQRAASISVSVSNRVAANLMRLWLQSASAARMGRRSKVRMNHFSDVPVLFNIK